MDFEIPREIHAATHDMIFARTGGKDGDGRGIMCFLVPTSDPGFKAEEYMWTFNMPTDHARVSLTNIWVPATAVLGEVGNGLALAQHFVHENRIRQAASGVGAAQFCIDESVKYAKQRAAVRTHLSSPPPLSHHGGLRGDSDAQGGRLSVRFHQSQSGVSAPRNFNFDIKNGDQHELRTRQTRFR